MRACLAVTLAAVVVVWHSKEVTGISCPDCSYHKKCQPLPKNDCQLDFPVCACCPSCKLKEWDVCDSLSALCEVGLICTDEFGIAPAYLMWGDYSFIGTCERDESVVIVDHGEYFSEENETRRRRARKFNPAENARKRTAGLLNKLATSNNNQRRGH